MGNQPSLTDLVKAIQEALKAYHQPPGDVSPFADLQVFQQTLLEDECSPHEATNKILFDLLAKPVSRRPQKVDIVSRCFLDGEPMKMIARSLNISEATAFRWKNEAVEQMASILQVEESNVRQKQQAIMEKRLEQPTYSCLIGVDAQRRRLLELLDRRERPWLVSIEGLGGVGKTSLADAVARRVIEQRLFDEVAWVAVRQHIFRLQGRIQPVAAPAVTAEDLVDKLLTQLLPHLPRPETLSDEEAHRLLKTCLKQHRCLIVIDNLETLVDVESLLPALHDLTNPSKFLLTSRESLYHEPAVYSLPLPELSEADTLQLIRHEIDHHELSALQQAGDEDLKKIYQVVGGNPLAIRLVIGQTHIFTLKAILDDLRNVHSRPVEELYTFIYDRAWQTLDEPTRELFLAMPLLTNAGEPLDELVELSELDPATVRTSLRRLVVLNLVNVSGDHTTRRYSIHNLTRTFLQEQVLKWT